MGVALAVLIATASMTARADFRDAVKAYSSGKYDQAHAEFLSLAELGDGASQFNLGAMALHGQGVPKDTAVGVGWLLAAASNGYDGLKPEQLAAAKASLTDEQRKVAQNIFDRYGHDALLETVLPRMDVDGECPGVVPARLTKSAGGQYPPALRNEFRDGIVIVGLTIAVDGRAKDPEVLMSVPGEKIPAVAIESFLRSRYAPATRGGAPFESRIRIKMSFSIAGGGAMWDIGALEKVREAADAGDPDGEYLAGLAGTLDRSVGFPAADAWHMLLQAAQGGQRQAQYFIGRTLEVFSACGGDTKSRMWMRHAAASGDASAQVDLAEDLLKGTPSADAVTSARALLEQAARSDRFYVRKHVGALLAASPIASIRDPSTALEVAKELSRGAIQSDPQMFEVIAAAYAASGDFSSAVSRQERAVKEATELSWNTGRMEERLSAYRNSQAWYGDLFSLPLSATPPPALRSTQIVCEGNHDARCPH